MRAYVTVRDDATDALKLIAPDVRAALKKALDPLQRSLTQDVRARALAHMRFEGAKPGLYLASIYGGVADKDTRVTGFVRSTNQLAHLFEAGFTISDILIAAKSAGAVMAFWMTAGLFFREYVHRHATAVQAYPAFGPAFDARAAEIERTLTAAGGGAIEGTFR